MLYAFWRDNFQVKSRLVITDNEWIPATIHVYELWKYFLEQSKSFVLHQNQVSSCKGYGYWFKKFKDFPSQSSDGAPSFWSLFVATFRPTLDSTFNIITTRLEPVRLEPSAPSHISSSWWPHDVDSVLSVSVVCIAGIGRLRTGDSMWPALLSVAPRHH